MCKFIKYEMYLQGIAYKSEDSTKNLIMKTIYEIKSNWKYIRLYLSIHLRQLYKECKSEIRMKEAKRVNTIITCSKRRNALFKTLLLVN